MTTRSHFVKKSRKEIKLDDGTVLPVGSPYYWWKFRYGGTHRSISAPTRRQLTQNAFQHSLFDIEDAQNGLSADSPEDLRSGIEDLTTEIESLRDEQQNNLDNMPEQLQESSDSGQMLQERIDALQEMQDELEGIDVPDAPDFLVDGEVPSLPENPTDEQTETFNEQKEEFEQFKSDLEDALSSAQGVSYNGP